jgi:hypothetical protein
VDAILEATIQVLLSVGKERLASQGRLDLFDPDFWLSAFDLAGVDHALG